MFCCIWLFHILMPYNMMILYFLFYFIFMSQIVLYFLHRASVLSFYIDVVLTLSISTARSWVIFKLFRVEERDVAWFHESPSIWLNNMAHKCVKQLVCDMQVVNDAVECAVQDIQEYTHINQGPGDGDDVILATNHRFIVAVSQLHKNHLNAI